MANLQGPLTRQTVVGLLPQLPQLATAATVDAQNIGPVDSAGVAYLMALARACRSKGHSLTLRGLPGQAESLIRFYGLHELLPSTPK